MTNIFTVASLVTPVADSIGIGQAWRNMTVERTAQACALAALAATGKGHTDLTDLADKCFDHCEAEDNIRSLFIDARNIVARMQHRENSDEA